MFVDNFKFLFERNTYTTHLLKDIKIFISGKAEKNLGTQLLM